VPGTQSEDWQDRHHSTAPRGHFPAQLETQRDNRRLDHYRTHRLTTKFSHTARYYKSLMTTAYKWQFAPRFRRNAFGWKSDTPILLINEALTEIKAIAKKEPVLAAEGAVLFLEKLAPAI